MQLVALGGLSLTSSPFTRPKPLLLLSYLALEGAQQRKHLAELFWQEGNRMKSLSMAFTLLRQGAGNVVSVDAKQAKLTIDSDVQELLSALDKSDWQHAANLYTGAFLEGVVLDDWGNELEEWVYKTREYFAERVQYALLNLAEDAAERQDFETAVNHAERAYKLSGLGGTEVVNLKRLYSLLCAGKSLLAPEVRKELASYGLELQLKSDEARAMFVKESKLVQASHTLPMRGTSFVGRDVELTELATLLHQKHVSLLTLLGTAGVGKTRLALQLAFEQQKLGAFKDGVYFVSLESVSDASLIAVTLLSQLGLNQQEKVDPLHHLIDFFGDKQSLVVLDNLEHVVSGAKVLSLLLSNCSNLKLLVTSRETLKLEEEYVFVLEGLPVPKIFSDDARLSDAVQLFKERAQQVKPQFELENQLVDVVRICQLTEGLPLGIELAASWVRLMPCAEVAREMERGLELLTTDTKNIPERHRSLRVAFDYSWTLLSEKERDVFKNLAVFRGGFRREAASEVAGATIPMLALLVDKSFLKVLPNGRYTLHPLLHQYALEKLTENSDALHHTTEKHLLHYYELLQCQELAIQQGQQRDALRVFREEHDNIQLVLERGLHLDYLPELLRWLDLMDSYYDSRGTYSEALEFLARAELLLSEHHQAERGQVLAERAWYLLRTGNYHEAKQTVEEAGRVLPASAKAAVWISVYNIQGILSRRTGEQNAKAYFEQALVLARQSSDDMQLARILASLADEEDKLGNFESSENYWAEAIALYQQCGAVIGRVRNLNNFGFHYYTRGQNAKAKPLFEEGLQLAREVDFKQTIPYFLNNLAYISFDAGEFQNALELNLEALSVATETNEKAIQAEVYMALARCETALGGFEQAWEYSRQAIVLSREVGYILILLQALFARAELLAKLGYFQASAELCVVIREHPATTALEEKQALKLLDELKTQLTVRQMLVLETKVKQRLLEQDFFEHYVTAVLAALFTRPLTTA
jgi:predicted ATPase